MKKTGGLGKGLDALIPNSYLNIVEEEKETKMDLPQPLAEAGSTMGRPASGQKPDRESRGLALIPLDKIRPNHDQPRQHMEQAKIEALAASIEEQGLIHPILVKKTGPDSYEIICGERRYLAAKHNGWSEIPAVIKEAAGDELLELALVENIQREDLDAIEEAEAYSKLIGERALTPEYVGKRVGRDRTTIANAVRLLRLPGEVQSMIRSGTLSGGHARALLGLPSPEHQRHLAQRIVSEQLSVRQVEEIVQRTGAGKRRARRVRPLDAEVVDLEHRLSEKLGTKVRLFARKNNKGRIEIQYNSLDDLDRILQVIGVQHG